MKHLIVYSHPNPRSFNHAILDTLVRALESKGCEVRVRDLYAMNFNPSLTTDDISACKKGAPPDDIRVEHEHVSWADVITFIGPLWWGGLPAIARGYLERVFSDGFAYTGGDAGPRGLLAGKKIYTINTGDAPESAYRQTGLFDSMNKIFDTIFCQFCALQVIGHAYFMSVNAGDDDERKKMLKEVERIAGVIGS